MDKKEYQEKLSEINRLIAIEDYNSAAQVADSVDWKRVRNVQTLLMISEIYEAVNRYQDSKILLLRAYRRSPLGRTVLYRLVECTIALRQFDEAIEYYSEYVQAAPRDNNKYILKYKIYRGRGSSVEEQINILKEYLDQEKDSERWSYELAKLYKEAGRTQECINTCDDLVLWYQSGKYVIKALELKKKIAPLTPRQQQIYDNRFNNEEESYEDSEEPEASYLKAARAEKASLQQEAIKSELAVDISRAAKQKELAAVAQQQPADAGAPFSARGEMEQTKVIPQTAQDQTEETKVIPQTVQDQTEETKVIPQTVQDQTEETKVIPQTVQDQTEQTKVIPQVSPAPAEQAETGHPAASEIGVEELRKNVAESMKSIISGVGPRDEVDEQQAQLDRVIEQSKEDQEAAVASRGLGMTLALKKEEIKKPEAPQLTIDDILLSMGDKGDSVRRAVASQEAEEKPVSAADDVTVKAETPSVETGTEAEEAAQAAEETAQAAEETSAAAEETAQAAEETSAAAEETAQAAEETSVAAEETAQAAEEASAAAEETAKAAEEASAAAEETAKAAEEAAQAAEEIPAADAETAPASEPAIAEAKKPAQAAVHAAETAGAGASETVSAEERPSVQDILDAKTRVIPTGEISRLHEEFLQRESLAKSAGEKMAEKIAAEAEAQAISENARHEDQVDQVQSEKVQVMKEVHAEQEVEEPQYTAQPAGMTLKLYQRSLFNGFLGIGNLEEQIAKAIAQAESKGADKTSRSGNVLILGGHGCGKTTIATGIAKAVAEDRGTHTVKMARIYAADLNRKDIAATIAKIAGGVLIIEEAGDLEDGIVDQLTTAMEFRTDGMIMILEDEQRYIHDLLMRHPRFTMKFTSQIYLPVYSSADLVNFGELYAESRDCVYSDDAKTALTGRLEAAAKAGEAVSITNVVELTDRAIKNSGRFMRRIQSAKKRYDDQNRVILRAKDLR